MIKSENKQNITQVLALMRHSNFTPRIMESLLRHYGNLERIINADAGTLMAIEGMTTEIANSIAEATEHIEDAEIYYQTLLERKINATSRFDTDFPQLAFELNDPPSLLYYRGQLPLVDQKSVAIVGTPKASNAGIELTTKVAKICANEKVQVISSLNGGISIAAHLGVKSANGQSYAILESGLEHIHPEENRPIAIDIVSDGGLISEYEPETELQFENYQETNRIIAGISQALIITEFYKDDLVINDILKCCAEIGKMVFVIIDPENSGLLDEEALRNAVTCGAIPMVGLDKIDDIITSLV